MVTQQINAMDDRGGGTMCLLLFVGRRSASDNSSKEERQPAALARSSVAVSPVGILFAGRSRTEASQPIAMIT